MEESSRRSLLPRWWSSQVVASVDHREVLDRVKDDAGWNGRFAFMTLMSAGIAILGLLLSSPAVVIGAMLISPLMGPIIGLGFGLATFDSDEIRRSLAAMVTGTVLAVLFCALIVLFSPLQNVTAEIAARTRPNLFDLLVALFSGLAGVYATIRGRHGAVVGVAIATALMPPLAVVGFGLATLNQSVFLGAALLFFTNFMTIALAAAVVARLYRFGPRLSPQQTAVQSIVLVALFVALAVPLGVALKQVAREALANRQARDVLADQFGGDARIAQVTMDFDADPVRIEGVVFTPKVVAGAEPRATAALADLLGRPVAVSLEQIQVQAGAADAQAGQAGAAPAVPRMGEDVAARVALLAGVGREQVLVDRAAKRVMVRATPLPGATLAAYRALERRAAEASPGWRIELTPPPVAPDPVAFDGADIAPAGQATLADAAWGAQRLGVGIVASGTSARTDAVVAALAAAGIVATAERGNGSDVTLRWSAPGS